MSFRLPPVYPILDLKISRLPFQQLMGELCRAKISLLQLREKDVHSRRFFEEAVELVQLSFQYGFSVIINDRVDIAWLAGARGVHLGQQDLPIPEAREILGNERIIGCSTHNLSQALAAQESSADYVAIGPVYQTSSKKNPDPLVSWQDLVEIRKRVSKPLVAIGGITTANAKPLFDLGMDSVAVIRDIVCAGDIAGKIGEYLRIAGLPISV